MKTKKRLFKHCSQSLKTNAEDLFHQNASGKGFSPNSIFLFLNGIRKIPLILYFVLLLPAISWSQGFTISGTQLRDANGNNFIIKGFSVPTAWFTSDVNNNITNMRNKTNANCLRIVVTTSTPDAAWQTCVTNCIANKMIPMVELHDVTCGTSISQVQSMANWWAGKAWFLTRSDISKYILINIANEWGDWNMATNSPTTWRDGYLSAVSIMRNAGINTTLVIDAPNCGQDVQNGRTLRTYGPAVFNSDPRRNILFGVHMYCEWKNGGGSTISSGLPSIKNAGVPVYVGEFGFQHAEGSGTCDINEAQIISTCQSNGIGWQAWSWKGNGSPVQYLDLSSDWAGNSLSGWGNTVVNGSNGTKTAATASVFNSGGGGGGGTIGNGVYNIVVRHSGKSLDVNGASMADGAKVQQWTYGGGNNQKWTVTNLGDGTYSIRALHSGKGLDVNGASMADGAIVQQWFYGGGSNQRWRIESVGSGYYRIVNVNSSKCLDIVGASMSDGAATNQWTCSGNNNQSFQFNFLSARPANQTVTSSIPAVEADKKLPVAYPNPFNHSTLVEQSGSFTYNISDISGKIIEKGKRMNKLSTGSKLLPGIYFLRIHSANGTQVLKLIKN
ncbi:MAG: RICIN domain-containing protein [Ginsengibacter sp.]